MDETRIKVAYQEAGHVITASFQEEADPVCRVDITPHADRLGSIATVKKESKIPTHDQLFAMMVVAYGGHVAEKLTYGDTEEIKEKGFEANIAMATKLALHIVTGSEDNPSDDVYDKILKLTTAAKKKAEEIITENRGAYERVAAALITYQKLSGDEVRRVIKNKPVGRAPRLS